MERFNQENRTAGRLILETTKPENSLNFHRGAHRDIETNSAENGRVDLASSKYLVPLRFVFEHDLAEQTDLGHAVVEEFVVEFLQRKFFALLGFVIVT